MEYTLLGNKICLKTSNGFEFIIYSNILNFSIYESHVEAILFNGNKLRILHSLKELDIHLSKLMFCRCRSNCLVNLNHISIYVHKTGELYMSNKSKIVVAKDRRSVFKNMISNGILHGNGSHKVEMETL